MPAVVGNTTVVCPGCNEQITLSLRLERNDDAGSGQLVLAVDRSAVDEHLERAHPQAVDG
ncbi:hypothetical protein [Streptomyces justiciae]|uniref:Small CPxCG-related zinc finger protein n=1 Tax=Streptomyces justiciae TaxID=2780140 RepID=A0ABU3M6T0_9ACTN|nr:hypothetical protein [Streptomyces justiciae]MDT7847209.1 hypothetical protein [Streptomyces justiciae]